MNNKKHIGKLISIKYIDRPTYIFGFVIDSNEDWTLLKRNSADYSMDGYVILNHKNIKSCKRESVEKFKEKVIILKNQHVPNFSNFPISTLHNILKHLTEKYGTFSFDLKSEKACYLGKLRSLTSSRLTIDYLNPKGRWTKQMQFRPRDLRTIEFDTDYINSLRLISEVG